MKIQIRTTAVGALVFVASNLLIPPVNFVGGDRWFLNSSAGTWTTLGALASAAILVELLDRSSSVTRPCWLAVGASLAMLSYLFVLGPGNLFPFVIVVGLAMVIPTVLIAGYIGMFIAEFVQKG